MRGHKIFTIFQLLRVPHWIKNILVFVPSFFAGKLIEADFFLGSFLGFLIFSTTASSVYVFNDIYDVERDKLHPSKSKRPIARGDVSKKEGFLIFLLLALLSLALSFWLNKKFGLIISLYLLMNWLYSFKFKIIAPLDVFFVATGYMLRILAGGVITGIEVSSWLFVTSFFVALFVSLAKRFGEILQNQDVSYRATLSEYSRGFLLIAMAMAGGSAIITFSLYVIEKRSELIYSLLPATYSLFRYLMVVEKEKYSEPLFILRKDKHLQVATFLFVAFLVWSIYGR